MRMLATLAGAGAFVLVAHPALAAWTDTTWRMSVDEVVAAVGGDAREVRDESDQRVFDQRRLVTSSTVEDGIAYTVNYYFHRRRRGELTLVRIEPQSDADCDTMREIYVGRLGDGEFSNETMGMGKLGPRINLTTIDWPVEGSEETIGWTDIFVEGGETRFCHILYSERDLAPED